MTRAASLQRSVSTRPVSISSGGRPGIHNCARGTAPARQCRNHAIVVDEASRMDEQAWNAISTTLTATMGPARIIGNVHGRKNWFYRFSRQAQQGLTPGWAYHRIIAHDAVALANYHFDHAPQPMRITNAAM